MGWRTWASRVSGVHNDHVALLVVVGEGELWSLGKSSAHAAPVSEAVGWSRRRGVRSGSGGTSGGGACAGQSLVSPTAPRAAAPGCGDCVVGLGMGGVLGLEGVGVDGRVYGGRVDGLSLDGVRVKGLGFGFLGERSSKPCKDLEGASRELRDGAGLAEVQGVGDGVLLRLH